MKTNRNETFKVNALTILVRGALVAMFGLPTFACAADMADDSAEALMRPTNSVEIGVNTLSGDTSNKFREYNGLQRSDAGLIGNFAVFGGNAYQQGEGKTRWEVKGTDLGTDSRAFGASVSSQGEWNVGFGYDEMRHYTTPFQTPFQGSAGGNSFTLPNAFGAVVTKADGSTNPGSPAPTALTSLPAATGTRGLTPGQQSYFHTVDDLYSGRVNTNVTAGYVFNSQWSVNFEYNHLTQNGAKLTAAASNQMAAGTSGAASIVAPATGVATPTRNTNSTVVGEAISILMSPTKYETDTVALSAKWKGSNSFVTGGYYGSFFRDGYNGLSWSNPYVTSGYNANGASPTAVVATGSLYSAPTDTLSTAPGNDFHQLNLSGAYMFDQATKLVGGASYGRNTQNSSFLNDAALMQSALPRTSLDGLVITSNANLKLTNTSVKDLVLSGGVKYNERDNQTPSTIYNFYDIGHNTTRTIANAPYSNRKTQVELSGDYRITKGQNVQLAYEHEAIDRWCNSLASNPTATGGTVVYNATGSSNCVSVPHTNEDKLSARYRLKLEDVSFNISYVSANRRADQNHNAITPIGVTTYGYVNGGDAVGFNPYFDASRRQDILKTGVSWDLTEQLSVSLDARVGEDKYYDSALGVTRGRNWASNLDVTYNFTENSALSAYAGIQSRDRALKVAGTVSASTGAGTAVWLNRLRDEQSIFGLAGKLGGLMNGKLALKADASSSIGSAKFNTANPTLSTCAATATYSCGDVPNVKSDLWQVSLEGAYQLSKSSTVKLGYLYQKLRSNDYFYNIYQSGATPTSVMPTNQVAPSYGVDLLAVSYVYSFK